jgi:hypothetical protein
MRSIIIAISILAQAGCASVQMPGYISRIDHPYERKINGSFEKVVSSTMYILKTKGWKIDSEADPSIYERDDRYDNNGYQNLLIITSARKKYLYLTSTHLNVFIHSIGNTCNVEIRISARNDRMGKEILDALEQEVHG